MTKKIYFVWAAAICLLCGCSRNTIDDNIGLRRMTVEIPVQPDPMTVSTRAADDEALHDVN